MGDVIRLVFNFLGSDKEAFKILKTTNKFVRQSRKVDSLVKTVKRAI